MPWIHIIVFFIFNFDILLFLFILNVIILWIDIVEFDDDRRWLRLALLGWMLTVLYGWSFSSFVLAYLGVYYLQKVVLGLFHSLVSCCFSFVFSVLENLSFYWILANIWIFYQLGCWNQVFPGNPCLNIGFLRRLFRFLSGGILVGRL